MDVGGRSLESRKMVYHPLVTRVVPSMIMRRERMLPFRGQVLVSTGSGVEPSDIVATSILPSEVHLLNVARVLGIDSDDLTDHCRVSVGDQVAVGDVLAATGARAGLFGRTYRSPVRGIVAATANGRFLIQSSGDTLELKALYRGTVINVMSGLGAIIEVRGALIQGMWGSGKEGFGVLKLIAHNPDDQADLEAIDRSCRGTVVVAGSSIGEEALHRAEEVGVEGIVVGGFETGLEELSHSMTFPIVVTEGMGEFAISGPIFDLLKAHDGREVTIRGTMESRGGAVRPEIIIYVRQASGEPILEARPEFVLERGSPVRIVRGLHQGGTGTVARIPSRPQKLENGAISRGVEVRLESGEEVFVPQANLELFG